MYAHQVDRTLHVYIKLFRAWHIFQQKLNSNVEGGDNVMWVRKLTFDEIAKVLLNNYVCYDSN